MQSDMAASTIHIYPATEEDLGVIINIQFAVLHQPVIDGEDTPAQRAIMAERHKQHMRANPELIIVKAQLPDGKIAGSCMLYFPDRHASSRQSRVPTPLRPLSDDLSWAGITIEAPWFEDQQRRHEAEGALRFIHKGHEAYVAGRECVYVRYMCVEPAFQRQGVGKAILSWACVRFDEQSLPAYLEASKEGESLYKQFEFEVIGHAKSATDEYTHMWRKPSVKTEPS